MLTKVSAKFRRLPSYDVLSHPVGDTVFREQHVHYYSSRAPGNLEKPTNEKNKNRPRLIWASPKSVSRTQTHVSNLSCRSSLVGFSVHLCVNLALSLLQ